MKKKYSPTKFWKVTGEGEKTDVSILQYPFGLFLVEEGFYHFSKTLYTPCPIVRIHKNIIYEASTKIIKDHVLDYIDQLDSSFMKKQIKQLVKEKLVRGANNYFGNGKFEFLKTADIKPLRDTINKSYVPFKNGIVVITKEGFEVISYLEIGGQIWDTQIIDRKITILQESIIDCDFKEFLFNISGRDKDKFKRLMCLIGFSLHTYKDVAKPNAVIFLDEKDSIKEKQNVANGGTGKSLLANALGKMRTMHKGDGKNFDNNHKFKFQQVNRDTQILLIDDIDSKFEIEKLYPAISNVLVVEKKNKDAISLSFEEAPKILITGNYGIINDGGESFKRRVEVFEFSHFYNNDNRPFQQFGKRFFSQWDDKEWNDFDNFMLSCIKDYLTYGIPKNATPYNSPMSRFEFQHKSELIDFADNVILLELENKKQVRFDKSILFNEFLADNSDFNEGFTQKAFTSFLKNWGTERNIRYSEKASNGKSYILFFSG